MITNGKTVIISQSDKFLAKSLVSKLEGFGLYSVYVPADINEIKKQASDMELVVLFMNEELEDMPETLVYIKDIVQDKDLGLILIGEDYLFESVKKVMSESNITEWFKRPLDIDALVKRICSYMEDNTEENKKKTILIVDDDITYMRTVSGWLKGKYHVGMASSGVQAISYLAKNKADLVLLDYEMPIANGPQVLSMLKGDVETDMIPVMFLTSKGDKESVMSVIDLKPADYLLKTIDKETLLNKLELFFKNSDLKKRM